MNYSPATFDDLSHVHSAMAVSPPPARHLQRVAIDHLLVWAYAKQKVDHASDRGMHAMELAADGRAPARVSGDGCYSMARRAVLGTRVDGGGMVTAKVHPDADVIHEAVMRMECVGTRGLVMYHAQTDSVPDWMPGAKPLYRAVMNSRGKCKMEYDRNGNGIACLVDVVCSLENIGYHRGVYTRWWRSVANLAVYLQRCGMMSTYHAEMPSVLPEPWKV